MLVSSRSCWEKESSHPGFLNGIKSIRSDLEPKKLMIKIRLGLARLKDHTKHCLWNRHF